MALPKVKNRVTEDAVYEAIENLAETIRDAGIELDDLLANEEPIRRDLFKQNYPDLAHLVDEETEA